MGRDLNTFMNRPEPTDRAQLLDRLGALVQYDLAIVGGGATGLGIALDAAARGFSVVLIESEDFAHGTSSRSTKLLHGGVRYLAQGNISLVQEALHERSTVLHNAPHLSQRLSFILPCYKYWQIPFYAIGLQMYDALAGKRGLGKTQIMGSSATRRSMPNLQLRELKGSVRYWDAQFDDARLALALARTAAQRGALLVNYCKVNELIHENGRISGLVCEDRETQQSFKISAKCVINAAGVWVDRLRASDDATRNQVSQAIVAPSQGVHISVDASFLPGHEALIVPKTADGRVLFAVPWRGKVILGTTDTPRHDLSREPDPFKAELDFILDEGAKYLERAPTRADVKSIWVGLRPLVKPPSDDGDNTKKISREHTVLISPSKLVTVTGGKWTTYRVMAQDALNHCFDAGLLPKKQGDDTARLLLVGAQQNQHFVDPMVVAGGAALYGDEADELHNLPGHDNELGGQLTEAMVRFAARYEYARKVEDVLARRARILFLDARLAQSMAPSVAGILQSETGIDPGLSEFLELCEHYLRLP